jgi:hypothetical protein
VGFSNFCAVKLGCLLSWVRRVFPTRCDTDGGILHNSNTRLLKGLDALPETLFAGLSRFVEEYLGSHKAQVPFGGREGSLLQLEAWFASEHPYALLVAEAGRGKSALLIRWLSEVASSGRAQVVFLPISIRFGTSLKSAAFSILASQLKAKNSAPAPFSLEGYKAEIQERLGEDRAPTELPLLIVIDGLDEAADWQPEKEALWPSVLGNGVKVLVSARTLANRGEVEWRQSLGWTQENTLSIALPPLDRRGVADIFTQMGVPLSQLANNIDLTNELHRLSEGDPLLLRLHVEALQTQRDKIPFITEHELAQVSPGLGGFFERWWAEQRKLWRDGEEALVQTLLRLFSCALGPLSSQDLRALLAFHHVGDYQLDSALYALRRFVIGDKERGFVFSHPRLGYHIFLR